MKNILVPIDFSEESLNALDAACSFAGNLNAEVLILHVIEDPNIMSTKITGEIGYDPMANLYIKQLIEKTEEKLEALVKDAKYAKVNLTYKVDIDKAYSAIVKHITSHKASLIIMGSKGASGLKEVLVGSVADKVARYASCPVIVVKAEAQFNFLNHILFATDLDEDQDDVLKQLVPLIDLFNAHLHVFNATPTDTADFSDIEKRMKSMMKAHHVDDYTLIIEKDDDVADSILEYAQKKNVGLIAFGTHERHGLLHLLEKRVSKNLTNHASRPIWTVAI